MAGETHLTRLLTGLREEQKYSIRKMADVVGVSRETIRKYERGILIPSNQTILSIFDRLGIDPDKSSEAREILISVHQARRERENSGIRSFGASAQMELESISSGSDNDQIKSEKIVELFFSEVGPERRSESFEYFLKQKILRIIRS